jgi:hypothetical protein
MDFFGKGVEAALVEDGLRTIGLSKILLESCLAAYGEVQSFTKAVGLNCHRNCYQYFYQYYSIDFFCQALK